MSDTSVQQHTQPGAKPYCHTPGTVPATAIPSTRPFSRRDMLRGVAGLAGGIGLAAASSGVIRVPGPFGMRAPSAHAATGQCLVLYDGDGQWGWIGNVHSSLLVNLLGRFLPPGSSSNNTVRKTISQYRAGDTEKYAATFYLGTAYDTVLPDAFKNDVMKTTRPVVWFKYNVHQLAWTAPDAFRERFGMALYGNVSWPTYTNVRYKGQVIRRSPLDPEVSWMDPVDPSKAQAVAMIEDSTGSGYPIPYITRSGNFWYVGDIPFSYMSEEDRYMIFADVLFDVLGVAHAESRRALVRIEDVDATADPADLRRVADLLSAEGVPFSVGVVPMYRDPWGTYHNGTPTSINISAAKEVVAALKYMQSKGGDLIMHGTTHQFDSTANPYNAVTGDDFEFFRATENPDHTLTFVGPVPGDSSSWCGGVIAKGQKELAKAGLSVIGFEAPHYAASAVDYRVFASRFPLTYHRALYFESQPVTSRTASGGSPAATSRTKSARDGGSYARSAPTTATPAPLNFGGQFFPYVVTRDIYGQKILPENLGNIEPERWPDPVAGPFPTRFPADIIRAAQMNLVVRDAWASFFFHPFLPINYLADTIAGIKGAGYTFVKPSAVSI
ncbi:MAG: DUF2334 domain-containing protein [Chloroflexi bacterium CFX7]|nr:DUF2334 domain-containing protein [Chloroflexi bacterium CFX7]MCK6565832.1 polysaccharide deacetylase family protein [Dehalococcoidia bacterium]RIL01750.1 MAG: hypothetical protein DCC78_09965 [bacterium]